MIYIIIILSFCVILLFEAILNQGGKINRLTDSFDNFIKSEEDLE